MNSFVKFLLISIGIVTLCVAGCTALTIGGCATAIGVAAYQASNLPEYANATNLSNNYEPDFDSITQALENGVSLEHSDQKVPLNENILAVITEINGRDLDIYNKYDGQLNGHIVSNRAGTGTLVINGKSTECLIYVIELDEVDYFVCIRDTFKKLSQAPSNGLSD
ncbi:MAG: hypothetical protein ABGY95_06750 [Rubritalea sp.]|uniref:hypothetical protein n=1 Tax=Rubritalea sp. TaxID=2109375 RepID=UPI003242E203